MHPHTVETYEVMQKERFWYIIPKGNGSFQVVIGGSHATRFSGIEPAVYALTYLSERNRLLECVRKVQTVLTTGQLSQ